LVGGHSYGLIAVHVVKDKKGSNVNIIQLRNPWGSFEWNGDWGDKSDCWTDEAKAEVNFRDADDGTFWMSFDDFKKYFSRIQICKFQNEFSFTSFKCKHTQVGYHLVKMQVGQAGHHTVSVSQKDERCFPRNSGYEYNNCRFILMQLKDAHGISSGVTFMKGTKGYQDRDTYIEMDDLEKGTYYLFVEMEWNDTTPSAERCFNVTDYGPGKTSFLADEAGAYSIDKVLCEVYLSKACPTSGAAPEDVEVKPMTAKKAPLITRYECNQAPEGYNFVLVANEDPEARYRESVDYGTFEGLQILGSDEHKYDLDVGPGETKIILMRAEI
jgi:calpain-15